MFSLKTCVTCQNTRKKALLAILAISMLSMVLMGAMHDSKRKSVTVKVYDDFSGVDMVKTAVTRQDTVSGLLSEMYLDCSDLDYLSKEPDAELADGETLFIRRGNVITVICDGITANVVTTRKKVRDALAETGIVVGAEDIVTPALDESIGQDMLVSVVRVAKSESTESAAIPYTESTVEDSGLYIGESEIRQTGVNGEKKITYMSTLHDGIEVSREIVAEEVITEPVEKIIAVGTKVRENTHEKGFSYKKKLTVTATAYDPYPAGGSGLGITANGMKAQYGVVAVDPKVIPLGTRLYIESTDDGNSWSYGYCIAADTGGAIKGNKIDLCYNTVSECIQFGRRSANVYVLE